MTKQEAYSKRQKEKGNIKVAVWIDKTLVERLKKYAKKLRIK